MLMQIKSLKEEIDDLKNRSLSDMSIFQDRCQLENQQKLN